MKFLTLLLLFLSFNSNAKIYDAFMCYSAPDTVVMFGVLKNPGTLRINYSRLETNPQEIVLKVTKYQRSDNSIQAVGVHNGEEIININTQNGIGFADIDLTPFAGTEDVSFENEDVLCYFGKFED